MTRTVQRRGFTMIEVLIAAAVLAVLSSGLLATTWRLSRWAHEQIETLAADAYCQDILNVLYGLRYETLVATADMKDVPVVDAALPTVTTTDLRGRKTTRRLLHPDDSFKQPLCTVKLSELADKSGCRITVSLKWQVKPGVWVAEPHTLEAVRPNIERGTGSGGGS